MTIIPSRPLTLADVPADAVARFMKKVTVREGSCWMWTAAVSSDGYGVFKVHGQLIMYAHRLAILLAVGSLPYGKEADHRCHNPRTCVDGRSCPHRRCVNPHHLALVTREENMFNTRVSEEGEPTKW